MSFDAKQYELYEENYSFRLIAPKTWMIETKENCPMSSDCYLLEGNEHAIMIDSGMNTLNLKTYIEELGLVDKPVLGVINTHSHFDHTGGNGFFGRAFMHPLAEVGAKRPFRENPEDYILDYEITYVREGDIIDLGGRPLEILEIGAHDLASIAILDKTQRILFSGDELETGWINVGSFGMERQPGQTIERHYQNMLKLKAREDEFDIICPGHHGAPIARETLEHFLTCDRMILDGVPGSPELPKKNGGGHVTNPDVRVMRYKSAHLCYNQQHIREAE